LPIEENRVNLLEKYGNVFGNKKRHVDED